MLIGQHWEQVPVAALNGSELRVSRWGSVEASPPCPERRRIPGCILVEKMPHGSLLQRPRLILGHSFLPLDSARFVYEVFSLTANVGEREARRIEFSLR